MCIDYNREAFLVLMDKDGHVTYGGTEFFKERLTTFQPILTKDELENENVSRVDMACILDRAKAKSNAKNVRDVSDVLTPSKGNVFTDFLPEAKQTAAKQTGKDQLMQLSNASVVHDSSPEVHHTVKTGQSNGKKKAAKGQVRKRLNTMYEKKEKKSKQSKKAK